MKRVLFINSFDPIGNPNIIIPSVVSFPFVLNTFFVCVGLSCVGVVVFVVGGLLLVSVVVVVVAIVHVPAVFVPAVFVTVECLCCILVLLFLC